MTRLVIRRCAIHQLCNLNLPLACKCELCSHFFFIIICNCSFFPLVLHGALTCILCMLLFFKKKILTFLYRDVSISKISHTGASCYNADSHLETVAELYIDNSSAEVCSGWHVFLVDHNLIPSPPPPQIFNI